MDIGTDLKQSSIGVYVLGEEAPLVDTTCEVVARAIGITVALVDEGHDLGEVPVRGTKEDVVVVGHETEGIHGERIEGMDMCKGAVQLSHVLCGRKYVRPIVPAKDAVIESVCLKLSLLSWH